LARLGKLPLFYEDFYNGTKKIKSKLIKCINPPNCPPFRPIERYWAIVKRILKKTGKVVNANKGFQNSWNAAARKVSSKVVQNLMGITRLYLRGSA
jgi:hypothetical protein